MPSWDVVIFGDGSGSSWGRGAGWSSISVERDTWERRVWCGGVNDGTVNFGEVMAYLQPLTFLLNREEDRRRKHLPVRVLRVHIFTDSQYARDKGQANNRLRGKHSILWSAFSALSRQGILLHWHWIRRDSAPLNRLADQLSRAARLRLQDLGRDALSNPREG